MSGSLAALSNLLVGVGPLLGGIGGLVSRPAELGLFFVIGVFGTAHCLGMCGPLVSLYSDRLDEQTPGSEGWTWTLVRQHVLFNLGRTVIYALLGGFFGLLGGSVLTTADFAIPFGDEVRGVAGVLVGAVVVVAGIAYVFGHQNRVLSGDVPLFTSAFDRIYRVLVVRVDRWVGGRRIFALGFLHGFLPCPLLYPAFLYVLAWGDPVGGALALGMLGLGTFPAMFLFGTVYQSMSVRRHLLVNRTLGVAFALLGVHTTLMGLGLLGFDVPMLFALPFYQPLTSEGIRQVPILVALPVAAIGSLLLLGAGIVSLYHRRSVPYLLLTLALFVFAAQTAVAELAYLDLVPSDTHMTVDFLADAITVVLVIAAILYVTKLGNERDELNAERADGYEDGDR